MSNPWGSLGVCHVSATHLIFVVREQLLLSSGGCGRTVSPCPRTHYTSGLFLFTSRGAEENTHSTLPRSHFFVGFGVWLTLTQGVLVFLTLRIVLVILMQRDSTSSHTVWVLHHGSSRREQGCADLAISVHDRVGIAPTVVVGVYVLLRNG